MAQREVVDRWLAPSGGRLYGAPSGPRPAHRRGDLPTGGRPRGSSPPPPRRIGPGGPAPRGAGAVAGGPGAGAGRLRVAPQDARELARHRRGRQGGGRRGPRRRGAAALRAPSRSPRPASPRSRMRSAGRRDARGSGEAQPPPPRGAEATRRVPPAADPHSSRSTAWPTPSPLPRRRQAGERRPGSRPPMSSPGAPSTPEAEAGRELPCEVTIDKRIPAQAGLVRRLERRGRGPGRRRPPPRPRPRAGAPRAGSRPASARTSLLRPRRRPVVEGPASPRPASIRALRGRPRQGRRRPADRGRCTGAFDRPPPSPPPPPPEVVAGPSNHLSYGEVVRRITQRPVGCGAGAMRRLGATARSLASAGADAVRSAAAARCLAGLFPTRSEAEAAAARMTCRGSAPS